MTVDLSGENFRATKVIVDLEAIRWNTAEHLAKLGKSRRLMAVVKADGYGHGAARVLKAAIEGGVSWAGIALVEEGIELRNAGIEIPILALGPWNVSALPVFREYNILPLVYSLESARLLDEYGGRTTPAPTHLKVDTGMGRIGFTEEEFSEFLANLDRFPNLKIEGLMSHFACADEGEEDFSNRQKSVFNESLKRLRAKGIDPEWKHISNSAGIADIDCEGLNLFRLGIALYGQPPSQALKNPLRLKEAITWKTEIAHIKSLPTGSPVSYGRTFYTRRPSCVATLPIGYADGYNRLLSNKGEVLVRGKRAPVIGRVCMDLTMIDVTDIPNAALNDEAVLIGGQENDWISAAEIADKIGTINYEVVCAISKRVPRVYKG